MTKTQTTDAQTTPISPSPQMSAKVAEAFKALQAAQAAWAVIKSANRDEVLTIYEAQRAQRETLSVQFATEVQKVKELKAAFQSSRKVAKEAKISFKVAQEGLRARMNGAVKL